MFGKLFKRKEVQQCNNCKNFKETELLFYLKELDKRLKEFSRELSLIKSEINSVQSSIKNIPREIVVKNVLSI